MKILSPPAARAAILDGTAPDHLTVGGGLYLAGCTGLTGLPDHLTMRGYLSLAGCTGLTGLPDYLTVEGGLYLDGCTGLTCLPDHLTLRGSLYLDGCTGLRSWTGLVAWDEEMHRAPDAPASPGSRSSPGSRRPLPRSLGGATPTAPGAENSRARRHCHTGARRAGRPVRRPFTPPFCRKVNENSLATRITILSCDRAT